MWHENLTATDLQDLASKSNIFAFLESQWAVLEEKIGITTLMKVYKMLALILYRTFSNKKNQFLEIRR